LSLERERELEHHIQTRNFPTTLKIFLLVDIRFKHNKTTTTIHLMAPNFKQLIEEESSTVMEATTSRETDLPALSEEDEKETTKAAPVDLTPSKNSSPGRAETLHSMDDDENDDHGEDTGSDDMDTVRSQEEEDNSQNRQKKEKLAPKLNVLGGMIGIADESEEMKTASRFLSRGAYVAIGSWLALLYLSYTFAPPESFEYLEGTERNANFTILVLLIVTNGTMVSLTLRFQREMTVAMFKSNDDILTPTLL
jgi:DNA-directed RNA polymerase subunit H (RpoH/RPB5)